MTPSAPTNVNASDGEYASEVFISWSSLDIPDEYKIYRDGVWLCIVSSDLYQYSDIIAEMDVIYEYCIEAVNECGESDWDCDDGFVTSPGGDVNGDGSIDVLDIVLMVTIIIETYEPSVDEFLAADLNDDGVIDVLDIVLLVNIILGN